MNVQTLILAILNCQNATGYEIKKLSSEGAFSYFMDISYGSIYPTLSKLESENLITGESESQQGKPDKKIYTITDKGRQTFLEALANSPPKHDKFKSEFLLVAMSAQFCSLKTLKTAFDSHLADVKNILTKIDEFQSECNEASTDWIVRYGLHVTRSKLEFLEKHQDELLALAVTEDQITQAAE